MSNTEKNLHSGHRARMKARFLQSGIENFDEHNVVELLLFFGIPYKDTNEIAHRLITRFGSLAGILDAEAEELLSIEGVGENATVLLKLLPEICKLYVQQKSELGEGEIYDNVDKLGRMLTARYLGVERETVLLTLLDNSMKIISVETIYQGSVNSVQLSVRDLVEVALKKKAAMVVLSHNHPSGVAVPSLDDLETSSRLAELFDSIGTPLLEHILVAQNSYTPIMYTRYGERRTLPRLTGQTEGVDLSKFYKSENV